MADFIGLDLGTSAIKGVLLRDGKIAAQGKRQVEFLRPEPNQVEIDPEAHFQMVYELICELAKASRDGVAALSMAAASGNTLLLNQDGTPKSNIISWLDGRGDSSGWLPPENWRVHETVGWPGLSSFPLAHLEWFRRNRQLTSETMVGMNNDMLAFRLTGVRALDYSSATPFYLVDQCRRTYCDIYLDYFGITPRQLPKLLDSGDTIGTLKTPWLAPGLSRETRIVAGCFDHPAAARALGVTHLGDLLLSCGTSWVGFFPETERVIRKGELSDPFLSHSGGCRGTMFSIPQIGLKIAAYIRERFGDTPASYQKFNDEALANNTPSRKMMIDTATIFQQALHPRRPRRIIMTGGPAEGAAWPKLIEETLGIPVDISIFNSFAGAVGAAMLAQGATS